MSWFDFSKDLESYDCFFKSNYSEVSSWGWEQSFPLVFFICCHGVDIVVSCYIVNLDSYCGKSFRLELFQT